jgi:hypothetical protein
MLQTLFIIKWIAGDILLLPSGSLTETSVIIERKPISHEFKNCCKGRIELCQDSQTEIGPERISGTFIS